MGVSPVRYQDISLNVWTVDTTNPRRVGLTKHVIRAKLSGEPLTPIPAWAGGLPVLNCELFAGKSRYKEYSLVGYISVDADERDDRYARAVPC